MGFFSRLKNKMAVSPMMPVKPTFSPQFVNPTGRLPDSVRENIMRNLRGISGTLAQPNNMLPTMPMMAPQPIMGMENRMIPRPEKFSPEFGMRVPMFSNGLVADKDDLEMSGRSERTRRSLMRRYPSPLSRQDRALASGLGSVLNPPQDMSGSTVDFLNASPEQQIFGIDVELDRLELDLNEAQMNNDQNMVNMIGEQMNNLMAAKIRLSNMSGDLERSKDSLTATFENFKKRPDLLRQINPGTDMGAEGIGGVPNFMLRGFQESLRDRLKKGRFGDEVRKSFSSKQKQKSLQEAVDERRESLQKFSQGNMVNSNKPKNPNFVKTVETITAKLDDSLVDKDQENILDSLSEKLRIQELIDSLSKGKTMSNMDLMSISNILGSSKGIS